MVESFPSDQAQSFQRLVPGSGVSGVEIEERRYRGRKEGDQLGDRPLLVVFVGGLPVARGASMESPAMALEKEKATYEAHKQELLAYEGKFSVIHGDVITGIWDTYDDALRFAYQTHGMEPFMVKQVYAIEPVYYVACELPAP